MEKTTVYDKLNEFLLLFLLIFTPLAQGGVRPVALAWVEISATLMMFFWILKALTYPQTRADLSLALAPPIILLAYATAQYYFGKSVYFWATKTEMLKLSAYILILFVLLNTLKTRVQIRRTELAIIVIGFFMSMFYLMRYFGVSAPRGFVNPDHFSAYLGMIIPLPLGFFLAPAGEGSDSATAHGEKSPVNKKDEWVPLLIFFAIIMSAALFFTMSRGGILSFILGSLLTAFLISRRRSLKKSGWMLGVIAGLIILMILWLGATPVVERLLSIHVEIASLYLGGRLHIWQGLVGIVRDYPVFGSGLGTFNTVFPKYQLFENITRHFTYAHSDIFEPIGETGIAGFLLVGGVFIAASISLVQQFRKRHHPWVVGMAIGVFGSLATIFIHSFTDFNLKIPANVILLLTLVALLISILNHKKNMPGRSEKLRAQNKRMAILRYPATMGVLCLLVVYAIAVARPALAFYAASTEPATFQGLGKAIRLDPSNAEYHYQLGRLYGKSGLYTLQLARYQRAVSLNPTNSQYRQSLAWALGQRKKEPQAQREFQMAIELHPNYFYPYQLYARWLFYHASPENIERGKKMYKKAVMLNPDLDKEAIIDCDAFLNDLTPALDILQGTRESDVKLLVYLLDKGNIEAAIEFAEKYLKSYKQNAACFFWVAAKASHHARYDWGFLKKYYLKAIELEPQNSFFRYWYASDLGYRKYRVESDEQFNLILRDHPEYQEKIKQFRRDVYGEQI